MFRKQVILAAIGLIVAVLYLGYGNVFDSPARPSDEGPAEPVQTGPPRRIVSMAPSATEVLFALGLADRVVGVTRFCDYPPAATEKAQVGGYLDPNYEAIMRLEPDLAVVLTVHGDVESQLQKLDIPTLVLEHRTLSGIRASVEQVGARCGAEAAAEDLLADLREREEALRDAVAGGEQPTVLVSAGRDLGTRQLEEVYAVGPEQWLDDVIRLAGGKNALKNETTAFPVLTAESILRLNPDVIVELAHDLEKHDFTAEAVAGDWEALPELDAVKNGRVHVIGGDFVSIPGPRYIRIAEALARVLHPDAGWEQP